MTTNTTLREALEALIETAEQCDSWQSFPTAPLESARAALALTQHDEDGALLDDALSTVLWLQRRLPQGYGLMPFAKRTIEALGARTGVDVSEFLATPPAEKAGAAAIFYSPSAGAVIVAADGSITHVPNGDATAWGGAGSIDAVADCLMRAGHERDEAVSIATESMAKLLPPGRIEWSEITPGAVHRFVPDESADHAKRAGSLATEVSPQAVEVSAVAVEVGDLSKSAPEIDTFAGSVDSVKGSERERFEAWYEMHRGDRFVHGADGSAWQLWQAAWQARGQRAGDALDAERAAACVAACHSIPTYQLFSTDDEPTDLGGVMSSLRRVAERYWWIRDNPSKAENLVGYGCPDTLDKAIDAARASAAKGDA